MVFSSIIFLFYFLPAVLLVYYIVPRKFRNCVLLLSSLVFYGFNKPIYVLLMIFSIVCNFVFALCIDKHRENKRIAKALLVSSVVVNLALLGFFKYFGLFTDALNALPFLSVQSLNIILPIGISFFTFQTMSYVIDVYRADVSACKNILDFGTYVSFFPQLIAGPIVRYKDVAKRLANRDETLLQFGLGVRLFCIGLAKKVLLANRIGVLWESLKAMNGSGMLGSWAGIAAFAFQIYFDFSGYSDMARGLARMFGFEFRINFNYPYISKSITEFWRRWHISLSNWFFEYVYKPMGGNRKGTKLLVINLLVVWLLTGLWHGASVNFILWGLYFGVVLVIEKLFLSRIEDKTPSLVRHIYSLFVILVGWVIFCFRDIGEMLSYFKSMFSLSNGLVSQNALALIISYLPLLIICAVFCTPLLRRCYNRFSDKKYAWIFDCTLCAFALVLCTAALVGESYNPFIYFQF